MPKEQKHDEFGPKRSITYEKAEYGCIYCGRGAPSHSEVFSSGACKGCGAPGKEYKEVTTVETIPDAERKILFVNADDTKTDAEKIKAQVEAMGFETVDFADLVPNGASRNQKYDVVGKAARACGRVFIFPSKGLSMRGGKLANEAYHEANDYLPENSVKAIAFLSAKDSVAYLPYEMEGLACMATNVQAEQGWVDSGNRGWIFSTDRALERTMEVFRDSI
jgi:hypothetical protein